MMVVIGCRAGVAALLCILALIGCGQGNHGSVQSEATTIDRSLGDKKVDIEQLFHKADTSKGADYLIAERDIRDVGRTALPVLMSHQSDQDKLSAHLAFVLVTWIDKQPPEYAQALEYLDSLPKLLENKALAAPPPTGVANYLEKNFGNRVADLIALRLAKSADWPHWKVMGVLFYLSSQKVPSTTVPLIRFVIETDNEKWRGAAVEAISNAKHAKLTEELDAERTRAKTAKISFPKELDGI